MVVFCPNPWRENRFVPCSTLMLLARFQVFFAGFMNSFARKMRLSYTPKRNPAPNPTPENAFVYRISLRAV